MSLRHLVEIYGLDLLIVLLAIGAAATANLERTPQPFPRRQLLLPGLLALAGALILLAYPDIRDLADPVAWLAGVAGMLTGALRGGVIRLESDQAHRLVRVHRGRDAAWAGWTMALFAGIQGALETGLRAGNPYETTAEFLMMVAGGYLVGRAIVAWLRARAGPHLDLHKA